MFNPLVFSEVMQHLEFTYELAWELMRLETPVYLGCLAQRLFYGISFKKLPCQRGLQFI